MAQADDGGRKRLDQALVDRGLAESRARAQALILGGRVFTGERRLDKAGHRVASDAPLEVRGRDHPWVSRGGLKLAHGLAHFGFDPTGLTCLDVGASTGGFTDVLLHHGAARVYAVDVGYGQLAHRLRTDPRVVVLERLNARGITSDHVPEAVDLVVCDASFISLKTVLPAPMALTRPGASLIALIKPQFEAGRALVGKGGVVRDARVHEAVCRDVTEWLNSRPGWRVLGLCESPLKGPGGNVEFLVAAQHVEDGARSLSGAGENGR